MVHFNDRRHEAYKPESDKSLDREQGLPPEVPIPLNKNNIGIRLVHASDSASRRVGYQVLVDNEVVATLKLYHQFALDSFEPNKI